MLSYFPLALDLYFLALFALFNVIQDISSYRTTRRDHIIYFLVFSFDIALSLFTLFFPLSLVFCLWTFGRFLVLSFSIAFTPFSMSAILPFAAFLANRLVTRSASAFFAVLRSSFDRWEILGPSDGSPFGIDPVSVGRESAAVGLRDFEILCEAFADGPGVILFFAPGIVLQRCTRSLRLANLSRLSAIVRISSTHSRSCE